MIGAIIGDICGSPYEKHNVKRKNVSLFKENAHITDDTVMTIAISQALSGYEIYDDIFGMPDHCVDSMSFYGLKYPNIDYGTKFRNWLRSSNKQPYNSWGNGSAMRVSAAGWCTNTVEEAMDVAEATASVTHNTPEGIKGAQAIATSIVYLRGGHSKEELKNFIEINFGYDLNRSIDNIRKFNFFDMSCQKTVPQAIIAFLEATSFEDAIRNAISIGGDSDTIACMTGAIAEAYYPIPRNLINFATKKLQEADFHQADMFFYDTVVLERKSEERRKNETITLYPY